MRTWFRLVAGVMFALATASGALAGNGNSPQAFRVLDKHNKLVGYSLSDNLVARQINGVWVTFYAQPASGIFDRRPPPTSQLDDVGLLDVDRNLSLAREPAAERLVVG